MNNKLIVIAGPTASGKSRLALDIASKINACIISADSMQVYRYMDIGTAKPSIEEQMAVKHYLIDEVNPDCDFSAARYKELAARYISEAQARGELPILVGGTGFYINAVLYDANFPDCPPDNEYREYLQTLPNLYDLLKSTDPEAAAVIHPNNTKRIIRALSFYRQTGTRISEHNKEQKARKSPYDYKFYALTTPRRSLYDTINDRVDEMINAGLIEEVIKLRGMGYNACLKSMQGLSYKEINAYLDGLIPLDKAIAYIKQNTRHYAKRQITWFNNKTNAVKTIAPDILAEVSR